MADTSSGVKKSRPLTLAGRSNGVIVRFEKVPCRSGSPHGVFGTVYGLAGGPADAPRAACAAAGDAAAIVTAVTTIRTKCVFRMACVPCMSEVELRGDLRKPRRQDAGRRQPGASGDERLVVR